MAISMKTLSSMMYLKGAVNMIGLLDLDSGLTVGVNISERNYLYRYFNILEAVMRGDDCFAFRLEDEKSAIIPHDAVLDILTCIDIGPAIIEQFNNVEENSGVIRIAFKHINGEPDLVLTEKESDLIHTRTLRYNGKKYWIGKRNNKIIKTKNDPNEYDREYKHYVTSLRYDISIDRTKPPVINKTLDLLPKIYGKHGYSAAGLWDFIVTGDPWQ